MAETAAVVDVGSNTARLVIGQLAPAGIMVTYTKRVRPALARDLEHNGHIDGKTVKAAAAAVGQLCLLARERKVDSLDVLVTAPGRQARNGDELVNAIERAAGTEVRVLSSEEEARLAFAGAVALLPPFEGLAAVVDVGGASTEIAVGRDDGETDWRHSVDLGAFRLAERTGGAIEAARIEVARAFAGVAPPAARIALVVGGSARALGRITGGSLGPAELERAAAILPEFSPAELKRTFGIGKNRARLLSAAALILQEVQRRLDLPLVVAEGGVREGALLRALIRSG